MWNICVGKVALVNSDEHFMAEIQFSVSKFYITTSHLQVQPVADIQVFLNKYYGQIMCCVMLTNAT